jgi:hypothetical protein
VLLTAHAGSFDSESCADAFTMEMVTNHNTMHLRMKEIMLMLSRLGFRRMIWRSSIGRPTPGLAAGMQVIAEGFQVNEQRDGFHHLSPASKRKTILEYDDRRGTSCGL